MATITETSNVVGFGYAATKSLAKSASAQTDGQNKIWFDTGTHTIWRNGYEYGMPSIGNAAEADGATDNATITSAVGFTAKELSEFALSNQVMVSTVNECPAMAKVKGVQTFPNVTQVPSEYRGKKYLTIDYTLIENGTPKTFSVALIVDNTETNYTGVLVKIQEGGGSGTIDPSDLEDYVTKESAKDGTAITTTIDEYGQASMSYAKIARCQFEIGSSPIYKTGMLVISLLNRYYAGIVIIHINAGGSTYASGTLTDNIRAYVQSFGSAHTSSVQKLSDYIKFERVESVVDGKKNITYNVVFVMPAWDNGRFSILNSKDVELTNSTQTTSPTFYTNNVTYSQGVMDKSLQEYYNETSFKENPTVPNLATSTNDGKVANTKFVHDCINEISAGDLGLGSVYKFKGSVATPTFLPSSPDNGDVYNVRDTGMNYAAIVGNIVELPGCSMVTNGGLTYLGNDKYLVQEGYGTMVNPFKCSLNGSTMYLELEDHSGHYVIVSRSSGNRQGVLKKTSAGVLTLDTSITASTPWSSTGEIAVAANLVTNVYWDELGGNMDRVPYLQTMMDSSTSFYDNQYRMFAQWAGNDLVLKAEGSTASKPYYVVADKVGTSTVGSASQPVYIDNGIPTLCTRKHLIYKGLNDLDHGDSDTIDNSREDSFVIVRRDLNGDKTNLPYAYTRPMDVLYNWLVRKHMATATASGMMSADDFNKVSIIQKYSNVLLTDIETLKGKHTMTAYNYSVMLTDYSNKLNIVNWRGSLLPVRIKSTTGGVLFTFTDGGKQYDVTITNRNATGGDLLITEIPLANYWYQAT